MHERVLGVATAAMLCLAGVPAHGGDGYRLLEIDGHNVKWGMPEAGTGARITYAIAEQAGQSAGITNCRAVTGTAPLLERSAMTAATFGAALKSALATWESAADVRFVPVGSASQADLVIGSEITPDGIAYADVSPQPSGEPAFDRLTKAIICLNPEQRWTVGAAVPGSGGKTYDLAYALTHEIGHVLGLDHPSPRGELMSFEYGGGAVALRPGDVAGIVAIYGPPRDRRAPMIALISP